MFTATIYFPNDPSVGIQPHYFDMELDENLIDAFKDEPTWREEIRKKIADLYTEMDGDSKCRVYFSDEEF